MLAGAYRSFGLLFAALLLAVTVLFAAACASDSGGTATQTGPPFTAVPTSSMSGSLTIFAASSLTDAFNKEKDAFAAANPRVSIEFNFAGSPTLVTQLEQGARADVLATADERNMDAAIQNGSTVNAVAVFAHNKLAVIVPKANPANITSPVDLGRPGVKLVIAEQGVPAGDYARAVFAKLQADPQGGAGFVGRVLGNVISNAANVKAVVSTVQLGEADAGIVYVTDLTPDVANDITIIPIADAYNVIATYPIAVTTNADNPSLARAFIDFILSPPGQQVLQKHGFLPAQ